MNEHIPRSLKQESIISQIKYNWKGKETTKRLEEEEGADEYRGRGGEDQDERKRVGFECILMNGRRKERVQQESLFLF